jgi:hypothetical protein
MWQQLDNQKRVAVGQGDSYRRGYIRLTGEDITNRYQV